MQRFECRLNLELTWEEPLLNGMAAEDVDWSQIWKPTRVHFLNGHEVPHLQRNYSPEQTVRTLVCGVRFHSVYRFTAMY